MAGFWGIEVKPGQQYPIDLSEDDQVILRVTQATLGLGNSKGRSIVQCTIGEKSPIFLCSLLPKKNESCPLNLEFGEDDIDMVTFSVIGDRSVHLSGYYLPYEEEGEPVEGEYDSDSDDSDPFGVDISGSESDDSDYGTDEEFDEPIAKSGVVIEEIEDDETPSNGNRQSRQLLLKSDTGAPILESEDEDGFPKSKKNASNSNIEKLDSATEEKDKVKEKTKKRKENDGDDDAAGSKVKDLDKDHQGRKKKNKKKKQQAKEESTDGKVKQPEVSKSGNVQEQKQSNEKKPENKMDSVSNENHTEGKKQKNKNKKSQESEEKTKAGNSSNVRSFPNGLVIEDVAMGQPDGKRADPGKKVSVRYIGKLLKNGKIFDSNMRGAPFKFILGVGQVISGWDVGVKGMRVGDKRKLTIPPAMGYGQKGCAPAIPQNAWLVFDVELVGVN